MSSGCQPLVSTGTALFVLWVLTKIPAAAMMTVLSPVSPDDDAAAVLAGLVGDGSLGESPINATDDVAGNGAEGMTQFKASTAASTTSAAGEQHLLA